MQTTQITFMSLLLAHLLGDFLLQGEWISRNKSKNLRALGLHGLIHLILAWACLLFVAQVRFPSISAQFVVLLYIAAHLLIDKLKCTLTTRRILRDDWKTFLLDQLLHFIVLAIVAVLLAGTRLAELLRGITLTTEAKAHVLEVAIVYVAVIFGGGYLIRYLTRELAMDMPLESPANLNNAGLYIGWLERFLVITAIALQTPALVGLILTGKSIARFPEFKEVRFVEYFLIGTLLSIALSVLGGIILLALINGTVSLK